MTVVEWRSPRADVGDERAREVRMNELISAAESEDVSALRWELLKDFGHDEMANQLLGIPFASSEEQHDRSEALHEILRILKVLCGSEDAARRWLFRESYFSKAGGDQPYVSLENEEFWPMQVMLDWLIVFEKFQNDGRGSFPDLFPAE